MEKNNKDRQIFHDVMEKLRKGIAEADSFLSDYERKEKEKLARKKEKEKETMEGVEELCATSIA